MKPPMPPPDPVELLDRFSRQGAGPSSLVRLLMDGNSPVDSRGRYLHWDDMRHRSPEGGMSLEEWWVATSMARRAMAREIPLEDARGRRFRFCNVDRVQEMVHEIDRQASGQILTDEVVTSLESSQRYLVSSLVEEAITSSQLEGASTSRRVAKELLATGRAPRDKSEQMIVNNFQAMTFAQELAARELTPADVLELHRIVSDRTLDDPADAGRLQRPSDDRIAVYWHDTLLHAPPPAEQLPSRLVAMCRFANGESRHGFIHPVVRAIILHFWLAYDHPFADGNGRTARALFYWSMLHDGYWLTQYLSVSSVLREAPSRYARAYLLTETDDNDLTYFVLYNLDVVRRSITSLHDYLARKIAESREVESLLHGVPLNDRQLLVIRDALRDPNEPFTIAAQARRNGVTGESIRHDLAQLELLGLMTKTKRGKRYVYFAVPDLRTRIQSLRG